MKKSKRINALILAVVIMATLAMPVSAALPEPGITPFWQNMSQANVQINFVGNTGYASARASRMIGSTTLLDGVLSVYELVGDSWILIGGDSNVTSGSMNLSFTFNAVPGVTYMAEFTVTAYGNGPTESETFEQIVTYNG